MPKVGTTPNPKSKKNNQTSKESGQSLNLKQNGNASKGSKKKVVKPKREVLYPRVEVRVFVADPDRTPYDHTNGKPTEPKVLSGDIAKQLLQWKTEEDIANEQPKDKDGNTPKVDFGSDYLLTDFYGNKVRCLANINNRPYYSQLANDWKLEILRRKWKFNGESIIVDETGMDQDGQHRLIGLVLAIQEWELDSKKEVSEQKWQKLWKEEPYIESVVVLGVSSDDETINTMNTGKKRSETDVLYRSEWLAGKSEKERLALAKICGSAIKLLWTRTSYGEASNAPRRPHSELFEFLARHERLKECTTSIYQIAEGNDLAKMLPLGSAAALMYLMGSSATELEVYNGVNSEEAIDWSLWDKAYDFFTDIADNGKETELLREILLEIPTDLGGSYGRNLRLGTVIKGWYCYSDGKKMTKEKVQMETTFNGDGQAVLGEHPRVGGIDVEYEEQERIADEADAASTQTPAKLGKKDLVDGGTKECIKGGEHEYVTEDNETFCKKCLDPAPKPKRK